MTDRDEMQRVAIKSGWLDRTCSNCRHWFPAKEYACRLGQCHRWHGGNGSYGYCWEPENIPDDGVVVETDEGWGAYTGKKFGCILFEEKS